MQVTFLLLFHTDYITLQVYVTSSCSPYTSTSCHLSFQWPLWHPAKPHRHKTSSHLVKEQAGLDILEPFFLPDNAVHYQDVPQKSHHTYDGIQGGDSNSYDDWSSIFHWQLICGIRSCERTWAKVLQGAVVKYFSTGDGGQLHDTRWLQSPVSGRTKGSEGLQSKDFVGAVPFWWCWKEPALLLVNRLTLSLAKHIQINPKLQIRGKGRYWAAKAEIGALKSSCTCRWNLTSILAVLLYIPSNTLPPSFICCQAAEHRKLNSQALLMMVISYFKKRLGGGESDISLGHWKQCTRCRLKEGSSPSFHSL